MDDVDDLLRRALARAARHRRRPESTYRLQFHAGFTFLNAAAVVPYLAELGITHVYGSPYLRAAPGSTHGYDVIDHGRLNPELGTEADFDALLRALADHGMGHILDVVPNHMGVATNENAWWNDVLANGPASKYANHFDIAWRGSPRPELHDKVLLPLLGSQYGEVLENGELKLTYERDGFWVNYYDRRFPISPRTNPMRDSETPQQTIALLNGTPSEPRSFDALHELLERQSYRLAYWHTASDEINYRRFFDINDLAALAMERREVFEATHALIYRLLADGKLAGLRIDHPDGLSDPKQYFLRLQRHYLLACARAELAAQPLPAATDPAELLMAIGRRVEQMNFDASSDLPLYVVAEKLLAMDEPLPIDWAVSGTSGYDFLNMLNGLFVDGSTEAAFTRLYHEWTGEETPFEELVYRKKKLILEISLASELHMLAHQFDRLAQSHRRWRDFTLNGLIHVLRETIACFPVYRSYVTAEGVSEQDVARMDKAIEEAIRRNPRTDPSVFHFVRDAVLQRYPDGATDDDRAAQLALSGKFQQLTAPVTAKGMEDTAFYIYDRFISLNEVGGEPAHFGVAPDALHRYLADRQNAWPHALSALSTHDTKRSEDVRARLNVLSEMPDEWRKRVQRWAELNAPHRPPVAGRPAPDRNDEYLLYQTLVGAWALDDRSEARATFVTRIQAYMQKAMREAKVHTSWTDPNAAYEQAVHEFVARILDEASAGAFLADLRALLRRVSHLGLLNALSQTLVRLTAPGVPDTYQGTELWDFSLVDPDNRRPVDYCHRRSMLDELTRRIRASDGDVAELARELVAHLEDGRAKLYLTLTALRARRELSPLFSSGAYVPVTATGPRADHVFAFARRHEHHVAVVAVPRLVTQLVQTDTALPLGHDVWRETILMIPGMAHGGPLTDELTGKVHRLVNGGAASLAAGEVFSTCPVALLIGESRLDVAGT